MKIPLEEGFTVVTGPNGSGKSNILDGVLFCLGLANSKGMRADRLPDLVNSSLLKAGKSAETVVSVRFDLTDWVPDSAEEGLEETAEGPWIKSDQKEWVVTRRLRVMPGGSYSSTYSLDGEPCNLQHLQTQLRRLRIDPEGSNVVMQGDVTRIVSMSNRDRRVLIDELAGVALFDNRINQTRVKLDDVYERQERCRIVEQELLSSRNKLERDCEKARTYKDLREKLQLGRQRELILSFEESQKALSNLKDKKQTLLVKEEQDVKTISLFEEDLSNSTSTLNELQNKVKALGEDKLIAIQADLAGLESRTRELDRQGSINQSQGQKLQDEKNILLGRKQKILEEKKIQSSLQDEKSLEEAEIACKHAEAAVEVSRRRLGELAGRSGASIDNHIKHSNNLKEIQIKVQPLKEEIQKLRERLIQLDVREKELKLDQKRDIEDNQKVHKHLDYLDDQWNKLSKEIDTQKENIQNISELGSIQERTRVRLENEQSRLEKEVARLESRKETLYESRGTSALRLLLKSGLSGIHGTVSQLGEVEDSHRLALDVAAGARLGQIVVDDENIAAKAIGLLKKNKAGRLTFLPLNKIKNSSNNNKALQRSNLNATNKIIPGLVGKAFDLISFESVYSNVFSYVFGETLVFDDLISARKQLGLYRSVTLEGDLLEKSGAMTGGNFSTRGIGFTFGLSSEKDELQPIRNRLLEVGEALVKCRSEENLVIKSLDDARPLLSQLEKKQAALDAERISAKRSNQPLLSRTNELSERIIALDKTRKEYESTLKQLQLDIKPFLDELSSLDKHEKSHQLDADSNQWNKLELDLEEADKLLLGARNNRDTLLAKARENHHALERLEDHQSALIAEEEKLAQAVNLLAVGHKEWRTQQTELKEKRAYLEEQHKILQDAFGEHRRARDKAEVEVSRQRECLQEAQWKLERLREDLKSLDEEIRSSSIRLEEIEKTIPQPIPEIPDEIRSAGLKALQFSLDDLQQRMEHLEPVNMLALEELEELNQRLNDLIERLEVLSQERSELLLRIETVSTMRQEAFMEAFQAVDIHFREIFASLSDGDGHLQLDNPEDPLEGGLTLVAHPKGKPVRRLAAMSGGEKSLTALSFLFALQRFRPSPFYALDEVDSFLDGVNVERLAALIARQAEEAQFLVVSHRRPMIGASTRTIGVTQARGSHTQVIGLPQAA